MLTPFVIAQHWPGERTVMVRNPDYWEEGRPYLDEIVIQVMPEAATQVAALRSGDVDVVYDLASQSAADVEGYSETTVLSALGKTNIGMDMDNRVPPFDNKLVRQAMQAATDREAINQAVTLGLDSVAYDHSIHPSYPRFAPQYAPPAYDPDLARSLLAQAGYPDGIAVTLHTSTAGAQGMLEMAVAFQESAEPAGIQVDILRVPSDGYWTGVWMVEPFTVVWWNGRSNPDQALTLQYHSESRFNAPRYDNPALDVLIERAREQDLEGQKETYAEIQRILIEDVPRLVVAHRPLLYGARKDVRGVAPHPLGWPLIQDGWFDD